MGIDLVKPSVRRPARREPAGRTAIWRISDSRRLSSPVRCPSSPIPDPCWRAFAQEVRRGSHDGVGRLPEKMWGRGANGRGQFARRDRICRPRSSRWSRPARARRRSRWSGDAAPGRRISARVLRRLRAGAARRGAFRSATESEGETDARRKKRAPSRNERISHRSRSGWCRLRVSPFDLARGHLHGWRAAFWPEACLALGVHGKRGAIF